MEGNLCQHETATLKLLNLKIKLKMDMMTCCPNLRCLTLGCFKKKSKSIFVTKRFMAIGFVKVSRLCY